MSLKVINTIREAIINITLVSLSIMNFGTDKPSAKQFIASIACFAFGGIVALVYSISQGNAVNLDTGFGN